MIAIMLLMIVGGIALTQLVSDPHQVTLRWLRLGGVISISLLAVAATIVLIIQPSNHEPYVTGLAVWGVIIAVACMAQLITVQLAFRQTARLFSGAVCVFAAVIIGQMLPVVIKPPTATETMANFPTVLWIISSGFFTPGLLGGLLMTMLLGHAYLTAGNEMTQAPFKRLVIMLAGLLVLRAVTSGIFGLLPFLSTEPNGSSMARMWDMVMITARYAVGLIVPGVFVYMVGDCVRRCANQSATGILYVTTVLVMLGEGIAISLLGSTGFVF